MEVKQKRWTWIIGSVAILLLITLGGFFVKNRLDAEKKHVPIAMALDDGYLYPTVVSITSMMKNKNKNVVYDYYIMHPPEFAQDSKDKLEHLGKKYKDCNINLINMGEAYKSANDKGHITTPAYYRLSLSDLLPELNRILWVDGDTLTFGDLSPMYFDTDMEGLYYRGLLDETIDATVAFGIENDHCICSGVMVVNLEELRKDNVVAKFQDFIEKNNENLVQHDQTTINCVCADKIGKLDPKYCIFNYYFDTNSLLAYYNKLIAKYKYTVDELLAARDHPVLVHCVMKPWKQKVKYFDEWWQYAKMTDCYNEIYQKYGAVFNT
ncbi:MAG: glycosyltransferase family 8 protein [Clostridia bacterium]|nr:glycosyltransferase family 8 protein [Clostridia bacterium]